MKFEVYLDRRSEWRWRLRAPNGWIMATSSEGYGDKRNCTNAIRRIREGAADATVENQS